MASNTFIYALQEIAQADLDLQVDTIKACLCMTGNSCDTDAHDGTVTTLAGITTLNRSDATGYADVTLAAKTLALDDVNNRVKFDNTADIVFSGLSTPATGNYTGILLYKFITNDADSIPIFWIEFTAPIAKEATQVTVPPHADGIVLFT